MGFFRNDLPFRRQRQSYFFDSLAQKRTALKPSAFVRIWLQVLLVGLDHLLDHLAAHGTGLTGGQVAVVALLHVHAHLLRCVFTSKNRFFSLLKNAKCKKEAKCEIKRIFGRNHSFTLVRYKGAMNILRMHLNF